ncbi:MAG: hypothetical protein IJV77_04325 [Clostridia bacterium]|nr:hypothetical protein [Clostridia bacterium]
MKDFSLLFSALFKQSFRFDKSKAKGQKKWTIILLYAIVAICCLPMLAMVAYLLYEIGVLAVEIGATVGFLTCIFGISQVITLLFGLATVFNTIYFSKDNEMLLAYPIKPQTIFAVKLTFVYIIELMSSFATSVFMVVPFAIGAQLPFSIGLVFSFFILPVLPLFLATIIAIPLTYGMSFLKNRGVLSSIIYVLFATVLFVAYFFVVNSIGMAEESADMAQMLVALADQANAIANVLLPDKFLALSMVGGSFGTATLNFVYALLIDLALFAFAYFISSFVYKRSVSKQLETPKSNSNKKQKYESQNKVWAIIKKDFLEIIRYPALAFYCLFEIIIGPAFMLIMGLNMSSMFEVEIQEVGMSFVEIMAQIPDLVALVLICITCFMVFSTNYTATTAFTRENRNFYLLKILPVSYQKVVDAKAILAFIVNEIGVVVMLILAWAILHVPVLSVVISLVVCTVIGLVFSYVQVYLDMRSPKLNWDNISAGLKNNPASLFSLLLAVATLAILIGLYVLFSLAGISIMMYIYFVVICFVSLLCFFVARNVAIKNAQYIIENTNI